MEYPTMMKASFRWRNVPTYNAGLHSQMFRLLVIIPSISFARWTYWRKRGLKNCWKRLDLMRFTLVSIMFIPIRRMRRLKMSELTFDLCPIWFQVKKRVQAREATVTNSTSFLWTMIKSFIFVSGLPCLSCLCQILLIDSVCFPLSKRSSGSTKLKFLHLRADQIVSGTSWEINSSLDT